MKPFGAVFAVLLATALIIPAVAIAVEPIVLAPPASGVLTVPAGAPLVVPAGWVAGSRGLAMRGPQVTQFFLIITKHAEAGEEPLMLEVTAADSSKYWLPGVTPATSELVGFDLMPFNSMIGAKPYSKEWAYPIPEGLPAGEYTFESGFVQTRQAIDLLWYFDGQRSPLIFPASPAQDFPAWDFHVN